MLNQGNNQLNHADIEEELDIKSDKFFIDLSAFLAILNKFTFVRV